MFQSAEDFGGEWVDDAVASVHEYKTDPLSLLDSIS